MTATEQFIRDAIEGGWEAKSNIFFKGIVGGFPTFRVNLEALHPSKEISIPIQTILLDPEAWRAVGKVSGWADDVYGHCGLPCDDELDGKCCTFGRSSCEWFEKGWQWNMHRMVDALSEGKTIEEYIASL